MTINDEYNRAVIERNNLRKIVLSIKADIESITKLPEGNAYREKNIGRFVFHRHRAERALAELNIKIAGLHHAFEAEAIAQKDNRMEERRQRAEERERAAQERREAHEKRVAESAQRRKERQEEQARLDAEWAKLSVFEKILRLGKGKL